MFVLCKGITSSVEGTLAVIMCLSYSNWFHEILCWHLFQIQASSQLRGIGTTIGHTTARAQNSGIQTVVTSSATNQGSHVASSPQMSLKHGVCKLPIFYASI